MNPKQITLREGGTGRVERKKLVEGDKIEPIAALAGLDVSKGFLGWSIRQSRKL